MNESLLTNIPEKHHHKVAITLVIFILGLFMGIVFIWLKSQDRLANDPPAPTARDLLLSKPNPQITLTEEEIKMREETLNKDNAQVKLSPEQQRQREELMNKPNPVVN